MHVRQRQTGGLAIGLLVLMASAAFAQALSAQPTTAPLRFAMQPAPVGGSLTAAWDPNPEPEVTGYVVYLGTSSGMYNTVLDVGKVTAYTVAISDKTLTYYAALRAYGMFPDGTGGVSKATSVFSVEVHTTPSLPPPPPPPPLCPTLPVVTVYRNDFTKQLTLGNTGRIMLTLKAPAGHRLARAVVRWGTAAWTVDITNGGEYIGALKYTPTTIGVNTFWVDLYDDAGCHGTTAGTVRTVTVQ